MSAEDSARATRDHISLLVAKRERLTLGIADAFEQAVVAIERGVWTPTEAIEWWQWARTLKLPWASKRVSDAIGVPVNTLTTWKAGGIPEDEARLSGTYPLMHQLTPVRGTACVYMLFDVAGDCVYIGMSTYVRNRLKDHHREKKRLRLASWRIVVCSSVAAAAQLEGDLIYQYQPIGNTADRRNRRFVRATP